MVNFSFKIITKILANRLATIVLKFISIEQHAFVKNKSIYGSISITSEVINMLDNKVFDGQLVLKLDVKKSYDIIDWIFFCWFFVDLALRISFVTGWVLFSTMLS